MPLISMAPYNLDDVRILQKTYFNFTVSRQLYLHSMNTIACKALKVLYHFDDHCIELYICQQSTEKFKTFLREHNTGEGWAIFCLQSENSRSWGFLPLTYLPVYHISFLILQQSP